MIHRFLTHVRRGDRAAALSALAALALSSACSDKTPSLAPDGGSDGASAAPLFDAAMCASPGLATDGPADDHCIDADGGLTVTAVDPSVCHRTPEAGSDQGCPYGDTQFGMESDDDDCKYHVVWSSTPICEGTAPTIFTMTATYLGTNDPVTGAAPYTEVFTTTPLDAGGDAPYCDNLSLHIDLLNKSAAMTEGPPGTYTGPVYFDQPGAWTIRFHLVATCNDVPGSPHGHAAFHLTVP